MTTVTRTSRARSLRDERGFAIIIVMLLLLIGLGLGAAALSEVLASHSQADRDQRYNRALQAADAGVNVSLYGLNEVNLSTLNFNGGLSLVSNLVDCLPLLGNGLSLTVGPAQAAVNGVCPTLSNPSPLPSEPIGAVPVANHSYYATAAVPVVTSDEGAGASSTSGHTQLGYKLYGYGWDDGGNQSNTSAYQIRKVVETVAPDDPFETVESTGDMTTNGIVVLNGDMRANGNLTENTEPVAALTLLGIPLGSVNLAGVNAVDLLGSNGLIDTSSIEYGAGKSLTRPAVNLSLLPAPTQLGSSFARAPVTLAASAPDCSPAANCATLLANYPSFYNASTDMFTDTSSTSTITLPGGDYIFCGFDVEKAQVVAQTTSALPVRIFVDSPQSARCSGNPSNTAGLGSFTAKQGVSNILGTTAINTVGGITSQLNALGGSGNLLSGVLSLLGSLTNTVTSLLNGLTQATLTSSNITSLTATTQLQIYVAGSTSDAAGAGSPSTKVDIGTSATSSPLTQAMFIYAPDSNVNMETNVFSGNIIGDNVDLIPASGAAMVVLQDLGLANSSLANALGAFHVQSYEECSTPSWSSVTSTLAAPTTTNLASGC